MSLFGIFHTAISVLAVPLGLVAFVQDGKINPHNRVGKLYLAAMLIGTVSAFGFILTKGFNPAQILTVVTLAVLLTGMFAGRTSWLGRAGAYLETISLTTSFLLLMVFTTSETLTRLPVGHPFAANVASPELNPVRLGLLVAYVLGLGYQLFKLHAAGSHNAAAPHRTSLS
jgi:uncharacterized membrane protein